MKRIREEATPQEQAELVEKLRQLPTSPKSTFDQQDRVLEKL